MEYDGTGGFNRAGEIILHVPQMALGEFQGKRAYWLRCQLTDAQADISAGATVLAVDPLDSGVGARIESYAKSHGVKVIDYDRLTLGGQRAYYVSFNNVRVGTLLGKAAG